ncbi:hypothetical protein R3P38DRAFT_2518051, partial [Favolaschia claudopus]
HQAECNSIHSWWSDSNSLGPTIPLHAFAKPLARFLHHRQVIALLQVKVDRCDSDLDAPLSWELFNLLTIYLESYEISSATKIFILRHLQNAGEPAKSQARIIVEGLSTFVGLLDSHSKEAHVLDNVCLLLGALAAWKSLRTKLVQIYPFRQLRSLSKHPNPTVREHFICALSQLIDLSIQATHGLLDAGFLTSQQHPQAAERLNFDWSADIVSLTLQPLGRSSIEFAAATEACQWLTSVIDDDELIWTGFKDSAMSTLLSISRGQLISVQALATGVNFKWICGKLDSPSTSLTLLACQLLANIAQHRSLVDSAFRVEACRRLIPLLRYCELEVSDAASYALFQISQIDFNLALLSEVNENADDANTNPCYRLLRSFARDEIQNIVAAKSGLCYDLISCFG